jgi:ubiquinone/menaquinone biosynthesis C-methylase UbiE
VKPGTAAVAAAGALAACAACAAVVLTDEAPYPYAQRRLLDLPLPFLGVSRLDALLQPRPGERMLEIGPGTGLQSLHVAPQLADGGELVIVDVQQQMLDHVMDRAARRSIGNISPRLASAEELPFPDAHFDAAYLVTVLGEIPRPLAALAELRRVLKPGGRLVVGEFADRHHLTLITLTRLANEAGLNFRRRTGVPFAYYALLAPAPGRP